MKKIPLTIDYRNITSLLQVCLNVAGVVNKYILFVTVMQ